MYMYELYVLTINRQPDERPKLWQLPLFLRPPSDALGFPPRGPQRKGE